MITNPYEDTDLADTWRMGFTRGYSGPAYSEGPPYVLAEEYIDSYNEGALVGAQCAVDGIPIRIACIPEEDPSLLEETAEVAKTAGHVALTWYEVGHAATTAAKLAAGLAGAFLIALEIAILGPTRGPRAEEVLSGVAAAIRDRLSSMGIEETFELFVATSFYQAMPACEYRFSNVFRSYDQALQAGRSSQWGENFVIARLDTASPGYVAFYNPAD